MNDERKLVAHDADVARVIVGESVGMSGIGEVDRGNNILSSLSLILGGGQVSGSLAGERARQLPGSWPCQLAKNKRWRMRTAWSSRMDV